MSGPTSEISPDTLRRARNGDERALERLVRSAYPTVRRWALVRTGDQAEADDLTQDVLIRMVQKLDTYEGSAAFETWLYRVTYNAALDRARRALRRTRLEEEHRTAEELTPSAGEDPQRALERTEVDGVLSAFLGELPPRQREAFDLVELQGRSASDAGALLGIEPVSVRAHLFKARRTLRARILARRPDIVEDYR